MAHPVTQEWLRQVARACGVYREPVMALVVSAVLGAACIPMTGFPVPGKMGPENGNDPVGYSPAPDESLRSAKEREADERRAAEQAAADKRAAEQEAAERRAAEQAAVERLAAERRAGRGREAPHEGERVASRGKKAPAGARQGFNAFMSVRCFRGGKLIATWSGPTRWSGPLPARYRGTMAGRRIEWQDPGISAGDVRVETAAGGSGGKTLHEWCKGTRVEVLVKSGQSATGSNPAGGLGGTKRQMASDATAPPARTGNRKAGDKARTAERDDTSATDDADTATDDVLSVLDDADTDDSCADSDATGGGKGGKKGKGKGAPGAKDAQTDQPSGARFGKKGGVRAEQGGVDGELARVGGEDFGDEQGAIGGEGERGDAGARGALALFGGAVDVPADIRAAVEIALALEDASVMGAGKSFFKTGVRQAAGPAALRTTLAHEARTHAAAGTRAIHKKLVKKKAFKQLSVEEQKRVLRITAWKLQRDYFEGVAAAAKKRQAALTRKLKRTRSPAKRAVLKQELAYADAVAEAVKVKPVAGRLPINHQYAGKQIPREKLPRGFRNRELRFTEEGFPDFEPFAKTLPNGKKQVKIKLTGDRALDNKAANQASGWKETPDGYRWHHHEDAGIMMLVPEDLHYAVKHTGGAAVYKQATGILSYD